MKKTDIWYWATKQPVRYFPDCTISFESFEDIRLNVVLKVEMPTPSMLMLPGLSV